MALFKVSKGASGALNSQALGDGYCWFTYDDGKFYIDYKDPSDNIVKRKALNAKRADEDDLGNVIKNCYAADMSLSGNTLTLYSKANSVLRSITLDLSKKTFIPNPALTATSGVWTWTIAAASAFEDSNIIVQVYETATEQLVYPDVLVDQTTGGINILINDTASAGTLTANTYKAVIVA